MFQKTKMAGIAAFFLLCLTTTVVEAADAPTSSSGPANLISANGFSCSVVEGQSQCQGAFEEIDKNLLFGARGTGDITLRVKKGDDSYLYFSKNGCLCDEDKDEVECKNASGKKEKFKGDKAKDQSSAFCNSK